MIGRLEECCFLCAGCGLRHCTQDDTSPGETDNLCPDCWATEDPDYRTEDELFADWLAAGWAS